MEEASTKDLEKQLLKKITGECDEPFKERSLFSDATDVDQMEMLIQLQHRFYNISRIMDCVSCDKCRLNGKVQVRGLATALKVLFLPDSQKQKVIQNLKIGEMVSLIQLASKLSESLLVLDKFTLIEAEMQLKWHRVSFVFSGVLGIGLLALMWICGAFKQSRK